MNLSKRLDILSTKFSFFLIKLKGIGKKINTFRKNIFKKKTKIPNKENYIYKLHNKLLLLVRNTNSLIAKDTKNFVLYDNLKEVFVCFINGLLLYLVFNSDGVLRFAAGFYIIPRWIEWLVVLLKRRVK